MSELLRFILSAVLMVLGIGSIALSVLGVFKFHFVLNRMHCAAITDTMGALCVLLSLSIAAGGISDVVKLFLILALLWVGSPISSHLVGRLEVSTDSDLVGHVKLKKFRKKEDAPHDGHH